MRSILHHLINHAITILCLGVIVFVVWFVISGLKQQSECRELCGAVGVLDCRSYNGGMFVVCGVEK